MSDGDPLTPMWWLKRLHKRLDKQRESFETYDSYYRGEPPRPPWIADQAYESFLRLLKLTRSNYMGLVVDATAERLHVEGFSLGDELRADDETWDIWQASRLDTTFDQALLEALIGGCSFLLIAPAPEGARWPAVYAESPTQVTVEYVPGTARTVAAAGLKVWTDDATGEQLATVYTPDRLYKYRALKSVTGTAVGQIRWSPRQVSGEQWPADNPIGVVPIVELANNPRLLTGGVSEIGDVVSVQDRIAKTLVDRLMTQDYGAFPQKWATGYPDADADGNRNVVDIGRDRLVTSDVAETRFGQWDAAPLDPYSAAKREDVKDIASRTRTPAQYLLGEMSNVNGETLKAAESGLVAKVRQRMKSLGDGAEQAMTIARKAAGLDTPARIETKWRNPEFRTEGETVDALVKMRTLGVPIEALWEKWGASPTEIAKWRAMADAEAARDPVGAMTRVLGQADGLPDDNA
jgi:Phage portal protein, SPP1 Gp6-like